jgi:hypothetical protein
MHPCLRRHIAAPSVPSLQRTRKCLLRAVLRSRLRADDARESPHDAWKARPVQPVEVGPRTGSVSVEARVFRLLDVRRGQRPYPPIPLNFKFSRRARLVTAMGWVVETGLVLASDRARVMVTVMGPKMVMGSA